MLTAFWCTTSFTVIIVLWKILMEPVNAHARWWPCVCLECGSGLRSLEKTLDFFRCIHVFDRVLKCGSDINEGNWLQLLFHFFVLVGIVASLIWMSFSQLCFRFYIEVLSYCTLTETFAIGFQKWFGLQWIDFRVFRSEMASFVDFISVGTEISKNCSIFNRFWRHQLFSMFSVRGNLVCSIKI